MIAIWSGTGTLSFLSASSNSTSRVELRLSLSVVSKPVQREVSILGLSAVGTGSGVLAIAAARLGFAPVLALDHEPQSVEAARENAAVNGVDIAVERFDVRNQPLPRLAGTVVLANLLLPLLLELSRTITERPRELVASGLLREQADEVAEVFLTRFQLHERRRLQRGEWTALWLSPD